MNRFVGECRREWKRLRVPDQVADEMAADLAADLEEAEAEGASPEEVLGSGASDPRSFAASWAAERAVIPPPRLRLRMRSILPAAIAASAVVAAVGAALVIFASPHVSTPTAPLGLPQPPSRPVTATFLRQAVALAPNGAVWVTSPRASSSGVDIHRSGSILLVVGIVGVTLSLPFLFWSSSRRLDIARS